MKIDYAAKMSILYDYYGILLPHKQNRIFTLYHEDNLSLSEIGQELGVSKQGVHDALKKAENALESFESKLGLVANSNKNEVIIHKIRQEIYKAKKEKIDTNSVLKILNNIDNNIDKLNI